MLDDRHARSSPSRRYSRATRHARPTRSATSSACRRPDTTASSAPSWTRPTPSATTRCSSSGCSGSASARRPAHVVRFPTAIRSAEPTLTHDWTHGEKFPRDRFDSIPHGIERVGAHRASARRRTCWIAFGWAALATVVLAVAGIAAVAVFNDRLDFGDAAVLTASPEPWSRPSRRSRPTSPSRC